MAADSPQELGSATATMPMEGSGMARMATDAPKLCKQSFPRRLGKLCAPAQASGQANGQDSGFEGSGQASASSMSVFQESMQQANALHEGLEMPSNM